MGNIVGSDLKEGCLFVMLAGVSSLAIRDMESAELKVLNSGQSRLRLIAVLKGLFTFPLLKFKRRTMLNAMWR